MRHGHNYGYEELVQDLNELVGSCCGEEGGDPGWTGGRDEEDEFHRGEHKEEGEAPLWT